VIILVLSEKSCAGEISDSRMVMIALGVYLYVVSNSANGYDPFGRSIDTRLMMLISFDRVALSHPLFLEFDLCEALYSPREVFDNVKCANVVH
jgi:hypothetical protein